MKHKEALHHLCACVLAFLMGYGCSACIATGLNLPINTLFLALCCAVAALVTGFCLSLRRGKPILIVSYGILYLFAILSPPFRQQLQAMCLRIALGFQHFYSIPIPQWVGSQTADNYLLPLLLIAGLVILITSWTIVCRKGIFPAVLTALLPLALCILLPDAQPDLLPLFLLITGILLLALTSSTRHQNEYQGSLLTGILLVPVGAALIGLMFIIPPGTQGPDIIYSSFDALLGQLDQSPAESDPVGTDHTDPSTDNNHKYDVNLSNLGSRLERTTPVMEITTNYSGVMYLRSRDYDVYSGLGWLSTQDRSEADFGLLPIWRDAPEFVSIHVVSLRDHYYIPCYPTKNHTFTGGKMLNPECSVRYTYSFNPLRSDWQNLWCQYHQGAVNAPEVPAADSRYLALPEGTSARAQALLSSLNLQNAGTSVDVAEIIKGYVSISAVYSNTPSQMPGNETDFSMWFLEEGEAGYCAHFASAATVLLRAAGIPARYVEGYMVQAQSGQKNVVQERMAHAWVEYYLDYVGWVIMDPTPNASTPPSVDTNPTEYPTIATDPQDTTPPVELPPVTAPPSEETVPTEPSVTLPTDTPPSTSSPTSPSGEITEDNSTDSDHLPPDTDHSTKGDWMQDFLGSITGIGAIVLVVILQWLLRRWLIWMWLRRGFTNAQALKRYRYVKYVARLCMTHIPDDLISLAEKAAFSQHQLSDTDLALFDVYISECIQAIRKKAWYHRLIFRFVFAVY